MSLPLNLILKLTRACSLHCSYCHDRTDRSPLMPFEVMALAIARAFASRYRDFRFIWHGGEPLLYGMKPLRKALAVQQELAGPDQRYQNNLQTNGLHLDDETARFLGDFDFRVGVSIDGPAAVHDQQRPTADGKPSHSRILKGIDCLRRHEVSFGVISVLTERSLGIPPAKLLRFYRDHELFDLCFLPVRGNARAQGETLDADRYYPYMMRLFDAWLELDDPRIRVREFGDWLLLSMGWPGSLCSSAASCVGGTLSVEPEGEVYHCDKFAGEPDYYFGHLRELDFEELPRSPTACRLRERDMELPSICLTCDWLKSCSGGCSHDRLVEGRHGSTTGTCHRRKLLDHVRARTAAHPTIQKHVAMAAEKAEAPPWTPC